MIIIAGLIVVVAAVVIGMADVLDNGGSGHALTHGFAGIRLPRRRLRGPAGGLRCCR
jgi:hypothetical protein